jgi:hypothetical protein
MELGSLAECGDRHGNHMLRHPMSSQGSFYLSKAYSGSWTGMLKGDNVMILISSTTRPSFRVYVTFHARIIPRGRINP